jgi:hypothetical protein
MFSPTSFFQKAAMKTKLLQAALTIYSLFFCAVAACAEEKSKAAFHPFPDKAIVWDMLEASINTAARGPNPFLGNKIVADFITPTGRKLVIKGFCDDQSGRTYRVRFMPQEAGRYTYVVRFSADGSERFTGSIEVKRGANKGMVQTDPQFPWHFIWSGTGEHYFYYGTTTYWLMGWKDESIIRGVIDRLSSKKVNRLRVAINGRSHGGSRWSEPNVVESEQFSFMLNPWIAERPQDLDDPGFDVKRFNVEYWQKLDRLVNYARAKDVVISLIFYVDGLDHGTDPFKKTNMGNADERRYYEYAASRYGAYSNVMWDVTNEYHLFRSQQWAEDMGSFLKSEDPFGHLISIHGHSDFPFRKSEWVNFTMFQNWDECSGYQQMLEYRKQQENTGIIKPQVNEEYGYEGHYPPWGCGTVKVAPGRSADNRADLAWQIYMAGCYQTAGERADEGTGAGNDNGGGWINGRGNERMILFDVYRPIYETFTSMEWWKMNPAPELINGKNLCLAEPGRQYLVYTQEPFVKLKIESGRYKVSLVSPRTGEKTELGEFNGDEWNYPTLPAKAKEDDKVAPLGEKWVVVFTVNGER